MHSENSFDGWSTDSAGVASTARFASPDRAERQVDSSPVSNELKTGTTTVGAVGVDGVVVAADARASLGGRFVANRSARKVVSVDERTAVAFAGGVGDAQSFVRHLRAELRQYELRHGDHASVEAAATVAGDLVRRGPFRILDLVLGGVDDAPAVFRIDGAGGVMDAPYTASGSGMQLAYGALEGAYEPDLPVADLRNIVATAVRSATERDTASGDGMTLATITADGLDLERFDSVPAAIDATAVPDGVDEIDRPDAVDGEEEVR